MTRILAILIATIATACGSFNYGKVETQPKKITIEIKGGIKNEHVVRCEDNNNTGFCERIGRLPNEVSDDDDDPVDGSDLM